MPKEQLQQLSRSAHPRGGFFQASECHPDHASLGSTFTRTIWCAASVARSPAPPRCARLPQRWPARARLGSADRPRPAARAAHRARLSAAPIITYSAASGRKSRGLLIASSVAVPGALSTRPQLVVSAPSSRMPSRPGWVGHFPVRGRMISGVEITLR
jgi:hypothetical protein